jgi:hypothetical protein
MRDPGIDETEVENTTIRLDRDVHFHAVRVGHTDFSLLARYLSFDKAGERFKRHGIPVYYTLEQGETGSAARSVSAHLCFAPVGVEKLPREIGLRVVFY